MTEQLCPVQAPLCKSLSVLLFSCLIVAGIQDVRMRFGYQILRFSIRRRSGTVNTSSSKPGSMGVLRNKLNVAKLTWCHSYRLPVLAAGQLEFRCHAPRESSMIAKV